MDTKDAHILQQMEEYVRQTLAQEGTGHDWTHIDRVRTTAVQLAQEEQADLFIVTASALLHDLIDEKVVASEKESVRDLLYWMGTLGVSDERKRAIVSILTTISYKGGTGTPVSMLEAQIVQDADRLDAMGAVGIARCFLYAGSKGHVLYDESVAVRENMTLSEYRQTPTPALNHFYEKLLKLKKFMNTKAGKREAAKRHAYMESFLVEFYRETGHAQMEMDRQD